MVTFFSDSLMDMFYSAIAFIEVSHVKGPKDKTNDIVYGLMQNPPWLHYITHINGTNKLIFWPFTLSML